VLSEVLTEKEQFEHDALWPHQQAFTRSCKAQLKRSHLFVDGVRVLMS